MSLGLRIAHIIMGFGLGMTATAQFFKHVVGCG